MGETEADATDIRFKIFKIFHTIKKDQKLRVIRMRMAGISSFLYNFVYREEQFQLLLEKVLSK